ncbi:DUF2393 domain-containing protein [Campylobacter insulaenigrae]|uniref:DUF2393 domain-containing protein n=2 Tax=Campylobacter insulaenigrae TaxID=260714 RepID=UPI0021524E68|nr:DUF2393 domain-containing protein [Campylobacter insulaenigrae]MCR6573911.1 DUF2393 domain-containing protein [Campylobacter insulaenigrae]MCR6586602.1 DUF2393 domain-containing protein [Campylobacter insulaenigrae]
MAMNAQQIREQMIFFTTHLHLVDFLLIIIVVSFFIATLITALIIRYKSDFAFCVIILGILCSASIAYLGYYIIDTQVRSRITKIDHFKHFTYDNSLSVGYSLTNTSEDNFNFCKITISVLKTQENINFLQKIVYAIKPLRSKSIMIKKIIKPEQTINLRTKFSDFKENQEFDVKINSKCF